MPGIAARVTLSGLLLVAVLAADDHPHTAGLGRVHFSVSCTAAAQKTFEQGVALLHSFWYAEAQKTFAAVTRADPACAMGYWGEAMSLYHPVWAPPAPEDLKRGSAAIEKAKWAAAKTLRERDYIAALDVFYRNSDKIGHRERSLAWSKAMERLSTQYPDDREAAIFFALSLIGTAPLTDRTYANQKRAAAILNRILPEQPDHPGIAHYMIHSYDSPQLASLALPAARSYARIAPEVPHALHMPSHIFTDLGLWQDSIDSNLASAAAAKKHGALQDQLHAMDYLVYAYLQLGRYDDAQRVVQEAAVITKVEPPAFQAAYALAAIPARYALVRQRWSEAAALEVRPAGFPWDRFTYAEAITHFARALGAARSGQLPLARREIERLVEIQKALAQSTQDYDWASQVEVQRLAASAWVAHAEGDQERALKWMSAAATLEDKSDKHAVTPGPVLPARTLLEELQKK
jgi:tetratricopeptide (TPR) repeat protein